MSKRWVLVRRIFVPLQTQKPKVIAVKRDFLLVHPELQMLLDLNHNEGKYN